MGVNLCRGDLGSSLLCYEGEPPFNFWSKNVQASTGTSYLQLEQDRNNVSEGDKDVHVVRALVSSLHYKVDVNKQRFNTYTVLTLTIIIRSVKITISSG